MIAREVMDTNVVTVSEKATLEEVFEIAHVQRTGDFVVVDASANYCGMLFETELLHKLHSETEKISVLRNVDFQKILHEELREIPVREFMNTRFRPFGPEETIERMAERMLFEKTTKMAVVDQGTKVIGSVSLSRILSNLMTKLAKENPVERSGCTKPVDDAKNKRFFQRVPFKAPVAYRLVSDDKQKAPEGRIAQTINISAGGLLILTEENLPMARNVNIALDLYQNNQPLRMVCHIVRCLPSKKEGCFEAGLLFVSIGVEERRRIEEHLMKHAPETDA